MSSLRLTLLALVVAFPSFAQNLTVIPVPVVSNDPTSPHAAYNGHATTFKAMARGGNGSYQVRWDFQGDGVFDTTFSSTNRYDLSTRFTYPNVVNDTDFVAVVEVTSAAQTVTASYRVHVFAEVPIDPNLASPRQLQIMRNVAIDDGLWFLHGALSRSGNEADPVIGARATATLSNCIIEGEVLDALGRNGHFIAFPPAYVGAMRDPVANAQRYAIPPGCGCISTSGGELALLGLMLVAWRRRSRRDLRAAVFTPVASPRLPHDCDLRAVGDAFELLLEVEVQPPEFVHTQLASLAFSDRWTVREQRWRDHPRTI